MFLQFVKIHHSLLTPHAVAGVWLGVRYSTLFPIIINKSICGNCNATLNNILVRRYSMSKMVSDIDIYYNTVLNYTKQAGELIKQRISAKEKKIDTKSSDIDFVTATDQEVEKILVEGLSSQFPDHEFIGEESIADGAECNLTDAPTWIIDPIDVLNQLFTAKKGKGAFLNGDQIRVSGQNELGKALITMEFGTSRDPQRRKVVLENFKNFTGVIHGFRSLGSAALNMAMVACGGADAYYEFGIHIWDIAAGELIVTEAGGVVIDPSGGPLDRMSRRVLAVSSQALAEQISKKLTQYYPQPRD